MFRGHETREPASVSRDDEQGHLFYSADRQLRQHEKHQMLPRVGQELKRLQSCNVS